MTTPADHEAAEKTAEKILACPELYMPRIGLSESEWVNFARAYKDVAGKLLERHEVQSLLRIIGAADAEETPVGQHLMQRLREMVGLTGNEVYCAQCYLNGSGWFELEGDVCPNPKCVMTAYHKIRIAARAATTKEAEDE